MAELQDAIEKAKDKMPNVTPVPESFHSQANAHELKSRLQWGEPGLTILDVRSHDAFNEGRIMGAMSMPMEQLVGMAEFSLAPERDIYVYGNTEEETSEAAQALRSAGFEKVAELKGGLTAWREIDGPVEGFATIEQPGPDAYNVGARLQAFKEEKAKEEKLK